MAEQEKQAEAAGAQRAARKKRKLVRTLLFLLYLSVLAEIGSRVYWAANSGVPIFRPGAILYRFYPNMRDSGVLEAKLGEGDGHLDVLMLGGSVLEDKFGTIEPHLREQLAEAMGRPVRTFNLGRLALSTLDSRNKYRLLGERQFDLVLLYHGINEVRMNNCPPEMFREDYTHSAWYVRINRLEDNWAMPVLTFPYTIEYTALHVLGNKRLEFYLPRHRPKRQWMKYGSRIRTDVPFRRNVEAILARAGRKREPVLLMTFASYVPADYSLEKFMAKELDYGKHGSPLEIWGEPANVVAGMAAHNAVIRSVAARSKGAIFVDQAKRMPGGAANFDDCCHLTDAGCRLFVQNLVPAVVTHLRPEGATATTRAGGR